MRLQKKVIVSLLLITALLISGFLFLMPSVRSYQFYEFSNANKVIIAFCNEQNIEINGPGIINNAKMYIQGFTQGWSQPAFIPEPGNQIMVVFYENEKVLGDYILGLNFLGYKPLQGHEYVWRDIHLITENNRDKFFQMLGIPKKEYDVCYLNSSFYRNINDPTMTNSTPPSQR
jgi:hypothetical protein